MILADSSPALLLRYVLVAAFLAYGLFRILSRRRRERRAETWPTVQGTTQGARLTAGTSATHPLVEIAYEYSVNGEYYGGLCQRGPFNSIHEAESFVETLPKELKIVVRYDPADPTRSTVRDEDQQANQSAAIA